MTGSPDDLLRASGLLDLGERPPIQAVDASLRRFSMTVNGSDPLRRATLREGAIRALRDAGVGSPARVVDAALAGAQETPDEREAKAGDPPRSAEDVYGRGRSILEAPDQLALFRASLRTMRYAGDTAAAELVHVALNSRALARPIGLAVQGPSAAGKTFTVGVASRHHPDDAVKEISAMSERYLAYTDFPTEHRYVSIAEASALHRDGVGATIVRELSWSSYLRYGTVVRTEDGPKAVTIEKPGPTGLITTSTKELDPEIATRLVSIQVTDAPEQTRAVVRELARVAAGDVDEELDLRAWHAASDWLAFHGERRVVVPYAAEVADGVPSDAVRMRRDFEQIMTVVRTHAFMHQATRQRAADGRIVATIDDYRAAYRLLARTLAVTLDSVSDAVRETVEKLEALCSGLRADEGISGGTLAGALGMSASGVSYRVKRAGGYITNLEARPGYPARYRPGEPLPEDRAVLPAPSEIDLPKSFEGSRGSAETREPPRETTVRTPLRKGGGVRSKGSGRSNPPSKASNPQAATEKAEGVRTFEEDEGGRERGGVQDDLSDLLDGVRGGDG